MAPSRSGLEVTTEDPLMPLVTIAAHWAQLPRKLVRELPLHYPSWRQMSPERKAGVVAKIGTQFDLRPHMESDRWPQIYAGIQQHLQKIYNGKKAALKERYWVPEEDGTYDLSCPQTGRFPAHFLRVNWECALAIRNDPKNLARAAQNKQNRAKSKVMETSATRESRLQTPPMGVPYTEDENQWPLFAGQASGDIPVLTVFARTGHVSYPPPLNSTPLHRYQLGSKRGRSSLHETTEVSGAGDEPGDYETTARMRTIV
ncbi:hypothetical protein Tco_0368790 [Tanacetum coccineum]